jgi:PAS domain S-box-containing protein
MANNKDSKEKLERDLMDLHERITELQQLEIERERAEKAVKKTEDKIHTLFGNAKETIVIIQDRLIKFINPAVAELLGQTPEELTGTSFAQYIHPDELPKLAKYYLQRIAGEDVPNVYKTIIKHKDGSDIPIEIKAAVIQYQGRLADFAIVRKLAEGTSSIR